MERACRTDTDPPMRRRVDWCANRLSHAVGTAFRIHHSNQSAQSASGSRSESTALSAMTEPFSVVSARRQFRGTVTVAVESILLNVSVVPTTSLHGCRLRRRDVRCRS
ncbi:hypothetical protein C8039_05435 [Halogeometricum sp. wsp3]|nr:hypothetical protein C8039_05435 [Halogeometricum sp. wsp3]